MFHGLGLLVQKKYEIDLSNEVLNIDFGQWAAKISKVKVGFEFLTIESSSKFNGPQHSSPLTNRDL